MTNNVCPACEIGTLCPQQNIDRNFTYKRLTVSVVVEFSVCSHCSEKIVEPHQALVNDRRYIAVRRRIMQLMGSDDMRVIYLNIDDTEALNTIVERVRLNEEKSGRPLRWYVPYRKINLVCIYDNDYTHDAKLTIDGDFANLAERLNYAQDIVDKLNRESHE